MIDTLYGREDHLELKNEIQFTSFVKPSFELFSVLKEQISIQELQSFIYFIPKIVQFAVGRS